MSADADPSTGVAVYDSTANRGASGWLVFGGTSASSPIVASVYALAGAESTFTSTNPAPTRAYSNSGALNDVTSGTNGSCSGSYLCTATVGYDGPTGWGTPSGLGGFGGSKLTATAASSTSINLAWSSISGATSYQVWRSVPGATFSEVANLNPAPPALVYSDAGLTPGVTYSYWVEGVAVNAVGSSNIASATALNSYEETSGAWSFGNGWSHVADVNASGGWDEQTTSATSAAELDFTGPDVVWTGPKGPSGAQASVSIDGASFGTVDTYAAFSTARQVLFSVGGLSSGSHALTIAWSGNSHGSILAYVVVDTGQATSANADPVIVAAGDIACDPADANFGGSDPSSCQMGATASVATGLSPSAVLPLGDEQYSSGTLSQFQNGYAHSWGNTLLSANVHPVPGNHEYLDAENGSEPAYGYYHWFASTPSQSPQGYYSYDLGAWHLIGLNAQCSFVACNAGSTQEQWLQNDLASHSNACTLAYWHQPRFSSASVTTSDTTFTPFWNDLYNASADLVLNGHSHLYERFAPQDPAQNADPTHGLTEMIVGSGGQDHETVGTVQPNSAFRDATDFGVLRVTLHPASYHWEFLTKAGVIVDSGTSSCVQPAPVMYSVSNTPTTWTAGQSQIYSVTLTNTTSQAWTAGGSNPVQLGVHFASAGGGVSSGATWYGDNRIGLPADVAPGASVTLTVTLTAPSTTGNLVVEYEMVKQYQYWFTQYADVNVTVQ